MLPNLRSVNLIGAELTPEDMAVMSTLESVELLTLGGETRLTTELVAPLVKDPNLPNLVRLNLWNADLDLATVDRANYKLAHAKVTVYGAAEWQHRRTQWENDPYNLR